MTTRVELERIISEALQRKAGAPKPCVICSQTNWIIGPKFVRLAAINNANTFTTTTQGYPLVPLTCGVCGNTYLINLVQLGFTSEVIDGMTLSE